MTPFQLNDNCNGDPEYSVTACLKAFVGRKVGCSLQWFNHEDLPRCKSIEQLLETKGMLGNIETVKCILHIMVFSGLINMDQEYSQDKIRRENWMSD